MGNPSRRGRRLAIRLAAFAVVGGALTVGVAWAIAAGGVEYFRHIGDPCEIVDAPPSLRPFAPRAMVIRHYDLGWSSSLSYALTDSAGNDATTPSFVSRRVGLPFECLALEYTLDWSLAKPWRRSARGVVRLWDDEIGGEVPVIILWPGFALDTAFYGAVAFTLWSAPGFVRRRFRRARGQCPACGYDLSGAKLAECPECGARREGVAEGTEEVPSASAHK
jgi:hypothetical protein